MDHSFPQRLDPRRGTFGTGSHIHPHEPGNARIAQSAYAKDQWKPKAYNYFNPDYNPNKTQDNFQQDSTYNFNPNYKCPTCFTGKQYFTLQNDLTNTVYCSSCRQPFHHCPQHKTPIAGVGYRANSEMGNKCQCTGGQDFLEDDTWNMCFRR